MLVVSSGTTQLWSRQVADDRRRYRRLTLGPGVKPADRVAYLSFNNQQPLEGYFAVLQAGAMATLHQRPAHSRGVGVHPAARRLSNGAAACPAIEHAIEIGRPMIEL
jgi:hypothetical protein